MRKKEEQLNTTRKFVEEQRLEFEQDMLDLEGMKTRLKQEQKRADDAITQVEKLNEEVSNPCRLSDITIYLMLQYCKFGDPLIFCANDHAIECVIY